MKSLYIICFCYSSPAYEQLSEEEKRKYQRLGNSWFSAREDGLLEKKIVKTLPSVTAAIDIQRSNVLPILSNKEYLELLEKTEKGRKGALITKRFNPSNIVVRFEKAPENFGNERTYQLRIPLLSQILGTGKFEVIDLALLEEYKKRAF